MSLLQQLKAFRDEQARREGVEPYFVLHFDTLEEIAKRRPATPTELATVKGMGPRKMAKYGTPILALVNGQPPTPARATDAVLTVSEYLQRLNVALAALPARLRGEVGRVEVRERAIYFDLRDENGEGVLSCLAFKSRYELMGVELIEGLAVVVGGTPTVYPRTGRLSLRVETIELLGGGQLRQAYRKLQRKLEAEGLFDPARKRPIPSFATRIGLITSAHGDAIHDFTANLERVGLSIKFLDCRVEGVRAVAELVAALDHCNRREDLDVVAIIRGGGSWESLQAFNNEAVCRAIAASRAPVLCGIGHERDVPLGALTADAYVSTPTAAAVALSQPWREAKLMVPQAAASVNQRLAEQFADHQQELPQLARQLNQAVGQSLNDQRQRLRLAAERLATMLSRLSAQWPQLLERLRAGLRACVASLRHRREHLRQRAGMVTSASQRWLVEARRRLEETERRIAAGNPARLLRRGWSLTYRGGKLVKSSRQLQAGDDVQLRFGEGGASSKITQLTT